MIQTSSSENQFEPELIPTFRFLMALPAVIALVRPLERLIERNFDPQVQPLPEFNTISFAEVSVLIMIISWLMVVVYLSMPTLPQRLGKWFLPIAFAVAAIGPLFGTAFVISNLTLRLDMGQLPIAWPLLYTLIIPISIMAWQYPWRVVLVTLGVLLLIEISICLLIAPTRAELQTFIQVVGSKDVMFLVVSYLISRLVHGQRQQRVALSAANLQLRQQAIELEQLATSRERVRVARELHDTLSHTMSGLILQLEGVQSLWEFDSTRARQAIEKTLVSARTGLGETRRALTNLRAEPLVDLGLREALRQLATGVAERGGLQLQLDLQAEELHLSAETNQALYRIAQECLTNIERHANATTVQLTLRSDAQRITLRIGDDGDGFDPWQSKEQTGYGLQGMRERAELIGGTLEVTSRKGTGTVVRVSIPQI